MANFIEVPAATLELFLENHGFTRTISEYGREVVYVRSLPMNPDVKVMVYTSIRDGNSAVRNCGKDSIKVATVFNDGFKRFGVGKFRPIFRVGTVETVLQRVLERICQAFERGNRWSRENHILRAS